MENKIRNRCPICGHEFEEVKEINFCPLGLHPFQDKFKPEELIGEDDDYAWVL